MRLASITSCSFLFLALSLAACGDDESTPTPDATQADAAASGADAATPDAGPVASAERGQYIVEHVAACGDCHTPRNMDGSLNQALALSGVECFLDIQPPNNDGFGCIHTRNLTNDPTGLMNRSDAEIKNMFQNGMRPNGEALVPLMPYYVFHNMTDVDADSIVLYLRTVAGVNHTVPANEAPFTPPAMPAAPINPAMIPMPSTVNASTMNGRYLSSMAGICIECHTNKTNPNDFGSIDTSKFFAGGQAFPSALLGLPVPPFPDTIYTRNITPDMTGIMGLTPAQIVTELHMGLDRNGAGICPPMPVGPFGAFGGMTDGDATDIANYLLAIPPLPANNVLNDCQMPMM